MKIEQDVAGVSRLMSYGRVAVTINSNCQWTLTISEIPICLPNGRLLDFCADKLIINASIFLRLLHTIEKSRLCIGNPDDRFFSARDHRNGKFMDQSGELI